MLRTARGAFLPPALLAAAPALASGGAHVVDDAAVETPGTCHLENWLTLTGGPGGLLTLAPACTRKAWPDLEIGGFVSHGWTRDSADTLIGFTPKLNLRSEERGVGIGIAASLGYGIDRGRIETASVIVPVTIPASKRLRFNLNGGWQWSKAGFGHDLFVGGQAEFTLKPNLSLMVEGFARDSGKAGGQAGLRWTTGKGRIDVDVLVGRYVDGVTPTAVTLGLTLRR
ncbi:hypothetical protein [Sphingomonas sp. DT-204]|uniref:hypothetical protein n=1 Tax=Sphingomonas sp. DT-204 TaxID=3396166 RepID=UPI003F1CE280